MKGLFWSRLARQVIMVMDDFEWWPHFDLSEFSCFEDFLASQRPRSCNILTEGQIGSPGTLGSKFNRFVSIQTIVACLNTRSQIPVKGVPWLISNKFLSKRLLRQKHAVFSDNFRLLTETANTCFLLFEWTKSLRPSALPMLASFAVVLKASPLLEEKGSS